MWGSGTYSQLTTVFQLEKSSLGDSGDSDPDPTDSSSPKTNLPFFQPKKLKPEKDTPH